jgi:hypothetical protein
MYSRPRSSLPYSVGLKVSENSRPAVWCGAVAKVGVGVGLVRVYVCFHVD